MAEVHSRGCVSRNRAPGHTHLARARVHNRAEVGGWCWVEVEVSPTVLRLKTRQLVPRDYGVEDPGSPGKSSRVS